MRTGHCTRDEVDTLRNRCRQVGLKDRQVGERLGVTRTYVNLLFNHRYPMRVKHVFAIESLLEKAE